MRKWARLTRDDGVTVDVNMDHVAYMCHEGDRTIVTLAYAKAEMNCVLVVKEAIDTIHQRTAMG
jgi:hypothetical protein